MGFGLLFIGYFFTYVGSITPFSEFTFVIGTGIIIYSLKNLIYENKMFVAAMISATLLELVSITKLIMSVFGYVNSAYEVVNYIQGYASPILSVLLVIAIYIIAKEVGFLKAQAKATVDFILLGIYVVSAVIFNAASSEFLKQRLFAVNVISLIICTVFTLIIIFNCYAGICYEGDESMEKETGNKILDPLNRALNKAMDKNKSQKTGKRK